MNELTLAFMDDLDIIEIIDSYVPYPLRDYMFALGDANPFEEVKELLWDDMEEVSYG